MQQNSQVLHVSTATIAGSHKETGGKKRKDVLSSAASKNCKSLGNTRNTALDVEQRCLFLQMVFVGK